MMDITRKNATDGTPATPKLAARLVNAPANIEQSYQRFVQESIDQQIQTVDCREDTQLRCVVLAGAIMLALDKRTGEIAIARREWLEAEHVWVFDYDSGNEVSLLFTTTSMRRFLASAWEARFIAFLDTTIGLENGPDDLSLEERDAVTQAGKRRVGKTSNAVGGGLNALWGFLFDREIARLTLAFFGHTANLANYNFTVEHKDVMRALITESPNLARLVGAHLHLPDILSQLRGAHSDNIISCLRAKLLVGIPATCGSFDRQRAALPFLAIPRPIIPLTPAGWRFLANSSRAVVNISCGSRGLIDGAAEALNILGKHNIHPPFTLLAHIVLGRGYRPIYGSNRNNEALYSRLIRLASEAAHRARRQGRLRRFISDEFLLVIDWFDRAFANPGDDTLGPIPKNATWNSLMRLQQEWHLEILRLKAMEAQERDCLAWPSVIQRETINGVEIQSLATGKALREEGEQMQHCVATYIDDCMLGRSRVFSVSRGGQRATLELGRGPSGSWVVAQLRGESNDEAPKALLIESRKFARLFNSRSKASESAHS